VKRILLIPVVGTIAALAMITYARNPRETKPTHPDLPPFDFPDAPEHAAPPEPDETEPPPEEATPDQPATEEAPPKKEPAPEAREFQLELHADGSLTGELVDPKNPGSVSFTSVDDLIKKLGDANHTLVITNGDGVDRAKLDEVEKTLRDHYTVRKVYRAAEAPPGEGR